MGTPNEQTWPGVTQLPDYKPSFPQWSASENGLGDTVDEVDNLGLDLLESFLVYDNAKRMSGECISLVVSVPDQKLIGRLAKRALKHEWIDPAAAKE